MEEDTEGEEVRADEISELISSADADKDGALTLAELASKHADKQLIEGPFKEADRDGNGKLSAEEMPSFLQRMEEETEGEEVTEEEEEEEASALLNSFDADKDGVLTFAELAEHAEDKQLVEGPFKEADTDGDGKLSAQEIPSFLQHMEVMEGEASPEEDEEAVEELRQEE